MLRDFAGGLSFAAPHMASGTAFFDSMLIDASGEQAAHIIEIPKSGVVEEIRIRIAAASNPQLLRVGLYTLDGSGNPTSTAYGGSVYGTATPSANSELVVTLGTPATVVARDRVAVVIEFDGTIGNVNIGRLQLITTNFPYTALYTGSWTKSASSPIVSLGYDDGSYPPMFGGFPSVTAFASTSFNVNTGTFDEYGFVWTAPFAGRLRGIVGVITPAAGADFEVIRYTGTTADETLVRDGDINGSSGSRPFYANFATGLTFARGDTIRVALRPTTANGITINVLTVASAAILESFFGTDFTLCRRLNQGAWTDESTMAPLLFPIFDQLDDAVGGGGGGGLLTHPGMGGGMRG